MKSRWYKDSFFYQIYPRSFCDSNGDGIGDIQGIISKLDYLKDLGITAVWLSPCYKSPNDDNGYDISDYRDIMDEFGTMQDFDLLIKGLHDRGIKLIMDLVVNHTSDEHYWFKESQKSKDNPYRDYYYWKKGRGKNGKKPPNNWTSNFLGSAWKYEKNTDEWYLHLFSYKQPDLNWHNPKVRKEITDICNFWFKKGVDGFRCDVITFVSKKNGLPDGKIKLPLIGFENYCLTDNYHDFIGEIADNAWNKYDTTIVGEAMGITSENAPLYIDEKVGQLDCVFSFEHTNCDRYFQVLPHNVNIKKLKQVLRNWQNLPTSCMPTLFWENHDQPRCVPRFVGYDCKGHFNEAAKMLAVALYMQRGVPFIYQGQEIAMTNLPVKEAKYILNCDEREQNILDSQEVYKDILSVNLFKTIKKSFPFAMPLAKWALSKCGRDHGRTPMQWTDDKNAGFCPDNVNPWMIVNPNCKYKNVQAQQKDENSVLNFYKKLIKFRLGNEYIINGQFNEFYQNSKKLYVYERRLGEKALAVVCNFTNKEVDFALPQCWIAKKSQLKLSNYNDSKLTNGRLRPLEASVYVIE